MSVESSSTSGPKAELGGRGRALAGKHLNASPPGSPNSNGDAPSSLRVPRHTALTAAAAAPKILLETLGARPATAILAATYVSFLACCAFDIYTTLGSFRSGVGVFPNAYCDASQSGATNAYGGGLWERQDSFGCVLSSPLSAYDTSQSSAWEEGAYSVDGGVSYVGHLGNLSNIISISLKVENLNSTVIFNATELDNRVIRYNVSLYACFDNQGCTLGAEQVRTRWQPVLQLRDERVLYSEFMLPGSNVASVMFVSNTFQNQEALPTGGRIRSYFFILRHVSETITEQGYVADSPFDPSEDYTTYTLSTISRPYIYSEAVIRPALLILSLVIFASFYRAIEASRSSATNVSPWFSERIWIVFYFIALMLYQNPFFCIANWIPNPSVYLIFSAYLCDAVGQASICVVWLMLADGTRRRIVGFWQFYLPKLVIGAGVLAAYAVITVIEFPSIYNSNNRNPVTAVANWSRETKLSFMIAYYSLVVALAVWSFSWLMSLWRNGRMLEGLPYMNTRYLQLSYRFFLLQASLATLYYIFEYAVVIYFISDHTELHKSLDSSTDNITTLFRYQMQLLGKLTFLTIYSIVLAFLFLPPASVLGGAALSPLAVTFAVSEEEMRDVVELRRVALRGHVAISNLAHTKVEIFCVDLGLRLLELAYEAYYDPGEGADQVTPSGYGPSDMAQRGYTLLEYLYDQQSDTYCCVVRDNVSGRFAVAFRGTSCRNHWSANLDYGQIPFDEGGLNLEELKTTDGLSDPQERNFRSFRSPNFSSDVTTAIREFADATSHVVFDTTQTVVNTTSGLITAAASHTPGLQLAVVKHVHNGFWLAYRSVRQFLHRSLRKHLSAGPCEVYFTGHSLGGALATLAAFDFSLHSKRRIADHIRINNSIPVDVDVVQVGMYNFGSPKVCNWAFMHEYNRYIPNSFRVVVDGDLVSAVPPTSAYSHVGTQVLVDSIGAGSLIVDPSFVERRLHTRMKTSIKSHSMSAYRVGLESVRQATFALRSHADRALQAGEEIDGYDLVAVALQASRAEGRDLDIEAGLGRDNSAAVAPSQDSYRALRSTDSQHGEFSSHSLRDDSSHSDTDLVVKEAPYLASDQDIASESFHGRVDTFIMSTHMLPMPFEVELDNKELDGDSRSVLEAGPRRLSLVSLVSDAPDALISTLGNIYSGATDFALFPLRAIGLVDGSSAEETAAGAELMMESGDVVRRR